MKWYSILLIKSLKKKVSIVCLAAEVYICKKIAEETIKEVLDQYLSKKTKLNENTFQRVKEDVIKIGDKYYKLTPVTIKQKTK